MMAAANGGDWPRSVQHLLSFTRVLLMLALMLACSCPSIPVMATDRPSVALHNLSLG
jgi:hypothetical protein